MTGESGEILGEVRIDALYRNTNDWKKPEDKFNRFFRFADGKGITTLRGFARKAKQREVPI